MDDGQLLSQLPPGLVQRYKVAMVTGMEAMSGLSKSLLLSEADLAMASAERRPPHSPVLSP